MADSIGTITVAIEAQTEELQRGLQSAETAVKNSAKNMEDATERLTERAEKSWTEFASKMGVIQQVAGIAKNAVKALADSALILGDDSASAAEKYNGVLNTLRDSGIPILSEAVSIGQSLRDIFDGTAKELAEMNRELEKQNEINARSELQLNMARYGASLRDVLADEKTRLKLIQKQEGSMTKARDAFRLQERQLRRKFKAELDGMKGVRGEGAEDFERRKQQAIELQEQIISQLREQATFADKQRHESWQKSLNAKLDQLAKEEELEKKALADKISREEAASKRIADKTLDLETRLSIMRAKASGEEEKARTLAIEARYRAMKVGATEAQLAIINQMQAIETAGGGSRVATASGGGTGTISTAIGGFAVATGRTEATKQTSLLKRIADSNDKVANAISNNGADGTIIVAS